MALFNNDNTTKEKEATKDLYVAENSAAKAKTGMAYRILVKPLISEKAAALGGENKYVFFVATDANKISVKKAIEEVYNVKPIAVNIINMEGKVVRRGRVTGQRKDYKKAIITLKKGDSITVYEGV